MSNRICASGCAGVGVSVPQPRELLQSLWLGFFFCIVRQIGTHLLPSLSIELASPSLSPPSNLDFTELLDLLGIDYVLLALAIGVFVLLGVFFPFTCLGILTFVVTSAEVLAPAFVACLSLFCTSRRDLVVARSTVSFCI